jgi:hypothetical protein
LTDLDAGLAILVQPLARELSGIVM